MWAAAVTPPSSGPLTLQVAALAEDPDVSELVQRSVVPPAAGGHVSAAGGLHDDEHCAGQDPQPAQPEDHQQGPAGPDPAGGTEPGAIVQSQACVKRMISLLVFHLRSTLISNASRGK